MLKTAKMRAWGGAEASVAGEGMGILFFIKLIRDDAGQFVPAVNTHKPQRKGHLHFTSLWMKGQPARRGRVGCWYQPGVLVLCEGPALTCTQLVPFECTFASTFPLRTRLCCWRQPRRTAPRPFHLCLRWRLLRDRHRLGWRRHSRRSRCRFRSWHRLCCWHQPSRCRFCGGWCRPHQLTPSPSGFIPVIHTICEWNMTESQRRLVLNILTQLKISRYTLDSLTQQFTGLIAQHVIHHGQCSCSASVVRVGYVHICIIVVQSCKQQTGTSKWTNIVKYSYNPSILLNTF